MLVSAYCATNGDDRYKNVRLIVSKSIFPTSSNSERESFVHSRQKWMTTKITEQTRSLRQPMEAYAAPLNPNAGKTRSGRRSANSPGIY